MANFGENIALTYFVFIIIIQMDSCQKVGIILSRIMPTL